MFFFCGEEGGPSIDDLHEVTTFKWTNMYTSVLNSLETVFSEFR